MGIFGSSGNGGGGYTRYTGRYGNQSGQNGNESSKYGHSGTEEKKPTSMEELRERINNPGQKSYKRAMEEKMVAQRVEIFKKATTQNGREVSESTKKMLEEMAEKMAEKELKKLDEKYKEVGIEARRFGLQGQMDKNGNISNARGQLVLKVDKKSGNVVKTQGWGGSLCKYDPKSIMCTNTITHFLQRSNEQPGGGNSLWGNSGNNSSDNGNKGWW